MVKAGMRHRLAAVAATLALGGLGAANALPASAEVTRVDRLNCNVSALELLGLDLSELIGNPCRAIDSGLQLPLGGGNHVYVLRGVTEIVPGLTGPQGATSEAALLDLKLLSDLIPVKVLDSAAYVTCAAGRPQLTAGSQTIGGIDVPTAAPLSIAAPLALGDIVFLNETVRSAAGITTRALRVSTPAGDVILSEATAGFTKNPCKRVRKKRR
jgi:hypothetical protein